MATPDKQLRISFVIDGTETVVAGLDKAQDAMEKIGKAGKGGSVLPSMPVAPASPKTRSPWDHIPGTEGRGMGGMFDALPPKEAQETAKAAEKVKDAIVTAAPAQKVITESVTAAKEATADMAGKYGNILTVLTDLDSSGLLTNLAQRMGTANVSAGGMLTSLQASAPAAATAAAPFAAIAAAAVLAQQAVAGVNDRLKEIDPDGYKEIIKDLGAWGTVIQGLSHPIDALKTEWKELQSDVSVGAQVIKDAIFDAFTGGAITNAKEMVAQRQITKMMTDSAAAIKRDRADIARQDLERQFREEADQIERAEKGTLNMLQVRAAARGAAAAQHDLADKKAIAAGASPGAIGIGRVGRDAEEEANKLQDNADKLAAAVTKAWDTLSAAQRDLESDKKAGLRGEDLEKSERSVDVIREQWRQLLADQEAAVEIARSAREEIAARAESDLLDAQTELGEELAGKAKEQIEAIKKVAEDNGQKVSDAGQESINTLSKIIEDGIVSPDEYAALNQAFTLYKNSQEGYNKQVRAGFEELIATERQGQAQLLEVLLIVKGLQNDRKAIWQRIGE